MELGGFDLRPSIWSNYGTPYAGLKHAPHVSEVHTALHMRVEVPDPVESQSLRDFARASLTDLNHTLWTTDDEISNNKH